MRRLPFFLITLVFLAGTLLPVPSTLRGVSSDEEKKKAFMESREGKPKARKTPGESSEKSKTTRKKKTKAKGKAKPKPARKKHKTPAPEETPHHKPRPTSEPESKPESKPKTPASKPEGTPAPTPAGAQSTPAPSPATSSSAAVIVQKSGESQEDATPTPEPHHWGWWPFGGPVYYKYLSRSVRDMIDRAPVARHRWRYIVVHNSGTRQGNAKAFDYYHLHVRKMPNGLAYHFVIGNGTSSGNGSVEIGNRWLRQINGGHVHSDYLNNIALGICLVGDFNHGTPTQQQLDALGELIRYLRNRVGKTEHKTAVVKAHKDINPPQWPTDCPGDKFPYRWLHSQFD